MSSSIQNWAVILKPKRLHMIEVSCGEKSKSQIWKTALFLKLVFYIAELFTIWALITRINVEQKQTEKKTEKTDRVD